MTAQALLTLVGGLTVLTLGAEVFVRGASGLARAAGVSPLVVGLTVVAFGTSAPEVAVSVEASLSGNPAVALGNVVGSNVFNILVILGLAALVSPLTVRRQLVRQDVPVLIVVSLLPFFMALDGGLQRWEGVLLLVGGTAYASFVIWSGLRRPGSGEGPELPRLHVTARSWVGGFVLLAIGLAGLVWGAELFLEGAITLARNLGVSEMVIGLTLVAAGTSLPELATSVVAAFRKERDIAVGNAIGSNILNILVVLGAASLVSPDGLPVPRAVWSFDLPVMAAVALVCLPIFFTDWTITRGEGLLFVTYYAAYLVYLFLDASGHEAESLFGAAVAYVAIPLTLLVGAVLWWRDRGEVGVPEPRRGPHSPGSHRPGDRSGPGDGR